MSVSEGKLNKQMSKFYVEHACCISSTGQVAKELSLETSRISELKGGRRQLTLEEAEIIKQIYGLPSKSEGYWIECELLTRTFHKDFVDNGLSLHFIKLIELFSNPEFINTILDRIDVNQSVIDGYHDPIFVPSNERDAVELVNKKIIKKHKQKLFNTLINEPDFQAWCDMTMKKIRLADDCDITDAYEDIEAEKTLHKICYNIEKYFSVARMDCIGRSHLSKIATLHLISQFKGLINSKTYANLLIDNKPFVFGHKLKLKPKMSPVKEYVLVGKCVWKSDRTLKLLTPKLASRSIWWVPKQNITTYSKIIASKDTTHISIKLFYTEQYQYLVEVKLFEDDYGFNSQRSLMIKVENRQHVFEELMEIFNYFNVEDSFILKHIKEAVAKNGGYIASAIYID